MSFRYLGGWSDGQLRMVRNDLPPGAVDIEFQVPFKVSQIKFFYLLCAKTYPFGAFNIGPGQLTIKTNSSVSPDQQFVMDAASIMGWDDTQVDPNPITVDIEKLFVSNTGVTRMNIDLLVLRDTSPGLAG